MNRANKTCNTKENVKRNICEAYISREKSSLSYEQRSQLQKYKRKKRDRSLLKLAYIEFFALSSRMVESRAKTDGIRGTGIRRGTYGALGMEWNGGARDAYGTKRRKERAKKGWAKIQLK